MLRVTTPTQHSRPPWRAMGLYLAAILALVWTLAPIYWLLRLSFISHLTLLTNPTPLLPDPPTLANYGWLFHPASGEAALIRRGFMNSMVIAVVVSALTIVFATPAAYAISRRRAHGASGLLFMVLLGRAYPPIALAVPFFWVYARVGLLGTRHGLVLAYLSITVPLVIWLLVGVFSALPPALLAASRVDGNTPWQTFWHVALPLAGPGIAGGTIVAFLSSWNEFTLAQFLLAGSSAQTFPLVVAPMLAGAPNEVAAAAVLGLMPAVVVALVFRRQLSEISPAAVAA